MSIILSLLLAVNQIPVLKYCPCGNSRADPYRKQGFIAKKNNKELSPRGPYFHCMSLSPAQSSPSMIFLMHGRVDMNMQASNIDIVNFVRSREEAIGVKRSAAGGDALCDKHQARQGAPPTGS